MARKMKRFAEGGNTTQQARYNRKVADIESDYQKWLKSGRYGNADVARAKYDQRMADARDDLAKWTGADRSSTRMDEQAAERRLSEARRTKGESVRRAAALDVTQKPIDLSGIKTDLSGIKTPPVTPTRRAAAAPSRRTATAVARPQAPAPRQQTAQASRPTSSASPGASPAPNAPPPQPTTSQSSNKAPSLYIGEAAARRQARNVPSRMSADLSGIGDVLRERNMAGYAEQARLRARAAAEKARRFAEEAAADRAARTPPPSAPFSRWQQAGIDKLMPLRDREEGEDYPLRAMRKGGTVKKMAKGGAAKKPVKKMAKGGSIDGCAVRGKTRAKRTK